MSYKDDVKLHTAIQQKHIKCKCGKSVLVMYDKVICKQCGKLVFRTKELEFKYRLEEQIKRSK